MFLFCFFFLHHKYTVAYMIPKLGLFWSLLFYFFFHRCLNPCLSHPALNGRKPTLILNYSGLGCRLVSAKELTHQIAHLLPLLSPSQQGRMRMNKGQLNTVAVEGEIPEKWTVNWTREWKLILLQRVWIGLCIPKGRSKRADWGGNRIPWLDVKGRAVLGFRVFFMDQCSTPSQFIVIAGIHEACLLDNSVVGEVGR